MTPGGDCQHTDTRPHREKPPFVAPKGKPSYPTKRVPQNQGQLWDLLPLLGELQQCGLARVLVEEIGNVLQGPAVVLRHR